MLKRQPHEPLRTWGSKRPLTDEKRASIAKALGDGLTNRQAAERCSVSAATVQNVRQQLKENR